MSAYKAYKHLVSNNVFNISKKIKDLRKSSKHDHKNRKSSD